MRKLWAMVLSDSILSLSTHLPFQTYSPSLVLVVVCSTSSACPIAERKLSHWTMIFLSIVSLSTSPGCTQRRGSLPCFLRTFAGALELVFRVGQLRCPYLVSCNVHRFSYVLTIFLVDINACPHKNRGQ